MPWKTNGVQITWYDHVHGCMWCPYSSVDAFLQNWELRYKSEYAVYAAKPFN